VCLAALFCGLFAALLRHREAIMLAQDAGGLWGAELFGGSSEEGGAQAGKEKGLRR
jgi:hypothetical protein